MPSTEKRMRTGPCVVQAVAITLCLGSSPLMAQAPVQAYAPRTYECAANAHCAVFCQIDGEKQMQTGAAMTVTITPIAPNNYVVELVEQNGHIQFLYLAGAKVAIWTG
jgi:hypothetical protein